MSLDRRYSVTRHGIAFRFNGFPIYENDPWSGESVIVGVVYEPQWNEADLTKRHQAEIDALVAEHLAARPQDDALRARHAILEHNGIAHTHREGKPILDHRPAYGYECSMCKASIVAKEPGDSPFYGGPWNGRWAVTGGAPVWRVPLRPAMVVWVDDSRLPPTPSIQTAEYRRGRDGGYYIDRQSLP